MFADSAAIAFSLARDTRYEGNAGQPLRTTMGRILRSLILAVVLIVLCLDPLAFASDIACDGVYQQGEYFRVCGNDATAVAVAIEDPRTRWGTLSVAVLNATEERIDFLPRRDIRITATKPRRNNKPCRMTLLSPDQIAQAERAAAGWRSFARRMGTALSDYGSTDVDPVQRRAQLGAEDVIDADRTASSIEMSTSGMLVNQTLFAGDSIVGFVRYDKYRNGCRVSEIVVTVGSDEYRFAAADLQAGGD